MEAVHVFRSSSEKPISPYKRGAVAAAYGAVYRHPSISRLASSEINFVVPPPLMNTGLLQAPILPPNYTPFHSYPPIFSIPQQQQQNKQPPLLPLPISSLKPINKPPGITRGLSLPPPSTAARKPHSKANINRSRDYSSSFTPRKSKPTKNTAKVEPSKPLGPDPKDLPKISSATQVTAVGEFSGSVVYTISPPPSSLPLPTFSLRPKLSCNAEAGGVDAGATDNLCRLLRLR